MRKSVTPRPESRPARCGGSADGSPRALVTGALRRPADAARKDTLSRHAGARIKQARTAHSGAPATACQTADFGKKRLRGVSCCISADVPATVRLPRGGGCMGVTRVFVANFLIGPRVWVAACLAMRGSERCVLVVVFILRPPLVGVITVLCCCACVVLVHRSALHPRRCCCDATPHPRLLFLSCAPAVVFSSPPVCVSTG